MKKKRILIAFGKVLMLVCLAAFALVCVFYYASPKADVQTIRTKAEETTAATEETRTIYPSENLLPYPYSSKSFTSNGLTYTDNGDGTLTINGIPTDYSAFYFSNTLSLSGEFILSGIPLGAELIYTVGFYNAIGNLVESLTAGSIKFNTADYVEFSYFNVSIKRKNNNVVIDNVIVKPMLNIGTVAYPFIPNLDGIYNNGYKDGESAGHETGKQEGYEEGYKAATDELSNLLITKGTGAYATPRNNVVGYVGGTDYLQFDTASGSADLTGLPNDPYVALRLEASVDVTSQYTISYKSLQGKCSLCFYLDGVIFNLFTLPETSTPVTINFTLPYGLGQSYVVNELVLVGYKEPLEFDFDNNHYTTGGPCVLKGMELYCVFDAKGAYDAGYDVGYDKGSEISEQEKKEKYEEGKQAGYNQGISEKTNAFSYINAIITAPVDAVLSMLDVDFMGWNLKGLLGLLVCGAIIAVVLKVLL